MDDGALKLSLPMGVQRFQRVGPDGPAYEVMGLGLAPATVRVYVFETEEEFDYPIVEARLDPAA